MEGVVSLNWTNRVRQKEVDTVDDVEPVAEK